jgi:nucleoside-diphosphate-sugar epimerase
MAPTALVVGGTGPTGPHVVGGLLDRGFTVTMLHTGRHERDEIPDVVEHVHTDPFDATAVDDALDGRTFDVAALMYGRLRDLAPVVGGRAGKLISVGGMPAVLGYGDPEALAPHGLPIPTHEATAVIAGPDARSDKVGRIVESEQAVFAAAPTATHFRYPLVYGPHQLVPREWMIVRRLLDGRPRIIVPDGGLLLRTAVHVANAAHALLLAVDQPERSAGRTYHVSDEDTPTIRQVIEIVAAALGRSVEVVSMPYDLATPARPMMMITGSFHRYTPSAALADELGYRDVVPAAEGIADTARWLAANPPAPGGSTERRLMDPFDYAAEDALLEAWDHAVAAVGPVAAAADPMITDRYSPHYEAMRAARHARSVAR